MASQQSNVYWTRDKVHWPRPVRPLFVFFGLEPVEVGSVKANEDWSVPVKGLRYLVRDGYVYQRNEPFGGDPPPLLARFSILFHLWRVNPPMRKRILGFDRFLRQGGLEKSVLQWRNEWKSEALRRLSPLRAFNPQQATPAEIADHLDACYDYLCWAWAPHIKIVMACVYIRGRWVELCDEYFGLTPFEAYELVQRSDPDLFAASNFLTDVARRAKNDPEVLAVLELPHAEALEQLRGTWFEDAVSEFIEHHGDRTVDTYELDPTWREMPELVVGMIKSFLDSDYDAEAEEAGFQTQRQERIEELRTRLSGDKRDNFDHWLELTEEAYPLIDTHDYLLGNIPASLVRYSAVEVGRRLVEAGSLADPEDTLFLYRKELTDVLRADKDVQRLVAERKSEYQRQLTVNPPDELGTPPPEPPYDVFPPAVADALRLITQQMSEIETSRSAEAQVLNDGRLQGLPGSPGNAEGPVRVVLTAQDFAAVQPGDVLVCPFTTPSWTVLFPKVSALVTDSGGALSHAAIVAREYGLPSVVGTGCATKELKNGQRVRVDGHTGTVEIVTEAEAVGGGSQ